MRLNYIEIENYKSFLTNQLIKLESGFNIFLGANNSGKTTALEVMELNYFNEPHKSIRNLHKFGDKPQGVSLLKASISTNLEELLKFNGSSHIPLPISIYNAPELHIKFFEKIIGNEEFELQLELSDKLNLTFNYPEGSSNKFSNQLNINYQALIFESSGNDRKYIPPSGFAQSSNLISYYTKYIPFIYRFKADRRPTNIFGTSDVILNKDATNLPYCINYLQTHDAYGHKILCEWINKVFPNVRWIQSVPISGNNTFELSCLPLAPESRRNDLAVSLDRMGLGIGNVIAILYVVLTARTPQVIAIDEPNSFLHPRALRELLQILTSEAKEHQIILTAHSADVLTAIKPNLITLFEHDGATTSIKQVNSSSISTLKTGLSDLGIRMTDLHGRDQVLWVEGQTEELVIPELLKVFCTEIAAGTAVLRVEHTGTFDKKGVDPTEVAKIYKRLTTSSALVPPMIAILLDRELHKPAECEKFERISGNTLLFLERRMLENFVLFPEPIAEILNSLGEKVTAKQIKKLLVNQGVSDNTDLVSIDGAKVLSSVFSEASESRHEFRKVRDVLNLILFLLENDPQKLSPLKDFLRTIFNLKTN